MIGTGTSPRPRIRPRVTHFVLKGFFWPTIFELKIHIFWQIFIFLTRRAIGIMLNFHRGILQRKLEIELTQSGDFSKLQSANPMYREERVNIKQNVVTKYIFLKVFPFLNRLILRFRLFLQEWQFRNFLIDGKNMEFCFKIFFF